MSHTSATIPGLQSILSKLSAPVSAQEREELSARLEHLPAGQSTSRDVGFYATSTDVADYLACQTIVPFLLARCPRLLERSTGTLDDLLTENVPLLALVEDWLLQADRPTLRQVHDILAHVTILDPMCGTGAFLLAALRVLERLQHVCLTRLENWPRHCQTSAERTHWLRSWILQHNLHGVDLIEEHVELCKGRLWLTLSVEQERPDLSANLHAGNALTGWDWRQAFPDILRAGGFDILLCNPPFLEKAEVAYRPVGLLTESTGAIHAYCVERSLQLLHRDGCYGFILPLAVASTQRMKVVQRLLEANRHVWYAHFAWRPAKLFADVNRAVSTVLGIPGEQAKVFTTPYQKWRARERATLIPRIRYAPVSPEQRSYWLPKIGSIEEGRLLEKMLAIPTTVGDAEQDGSQTDSEDRRIYYRTDGGLYWKVFTNFPPAFRLNSRPGHSTRETWITLRERESVPAVIAALSSDLYWWWYTVTSNCRHLNPTDVRDFPLPASVLNDRMLSELGESYLQDLIRHSEMRRRRQWQTGDTETQTFRIRRSRAWILRIGDILAPHYGITADECAWLARYDAEFRLGPDSNT